MTETGAGNVGPASANELEQATLFGFPGVLLEFYRDGSPDAEAGFVELGQRIWSVQNAISENRTYVPGAYLYPLGYVTFASTRSGNAYCIDTVHESSEGLPVVLFPHDINEEALR